MCCGSNLTERKTSFLQEFRLQSLINIFAVSKLIIFVRTLVDLLYVTLRVQPSSSLTSTKYHLNTQTIQTIRIQETTSEIWTHLSIYFLNNGRHITNNRLSKHVPPTCSGPHHRHIRRQSTGDDADSAGLFGRRAETQDKLKAEILFRREGFKTGN